MTTDLLQDAHWKESSISYREQVGVLRETVCMTSGYHSAENLCDFTISSPPSIQDVLWILIIMHVLLIMYVWESVYDFTVNLPSSGCSLKGDFNYHTSSVTVSMQNLYDFIVNRLSTLAWVMAISSLVSNEKASWFSVNRPPSCFKGNCNHPMLWLILQSSRGVCDFSSQTASPYSASNDMNGDTSQMWLL